MALLVFGEGVIPSDTVHERLAARTHKGMAHFAGTGPAGEKCSTCNHWTGGGTERTGTLRQISRADARSPRRPGSGQRGRLPALGQAHQEAGRQMIAFEIPATAIPFARAGSKGAQRFTPAPQRAFMAAVGLYARRAMAGTPVFTGPVEVSIRAVYPWPESWPIRKRLTAGRWKASKPDVDNAAKLICDAMNKIVFADDAQVACLKAQKLWGEAPKVTVSIQSLEVDP